MSAVNAAFKALIACSMMLRNGPYGGSFLSSELGPVMAGLLCENQMFVWVEILSCLCPVVPPRNTT